MKRYIILEKKQLQKRYGTVCLHVKTCKNRHVPILRYYGISNAYRRYGKVGTEIIGEGQTAAYESTQHRYGIITKPFVNSIYDVIDGG